MESYVEVSMLHNTATILLSFLMASYACVQPLPIRKMLVYALALSIPGCLLFFYLVSSCICTSVRTSV